MFICRIVILTLFGFASLVAQAIPNNTVFFCQHYPEAPSCGVGSVACQYCHVIAPTLNAYGADLKQDLEQFEEYDKTVESFSRLLPLSLPRIEDLDSDQDGFSNIMEINAGSEPWNDVSKPDPGEDLVYDFDFAFRRVGTTYCGQSPSYEARQSFVLKTDKKQELSRYLAQCLQSSYWRDFALQRLADKRIRPNLALGVDGDPFIIGDYNYDYRLFRHILTEGRDARLLLLADFHVAEDGSVTRDIIPDYRIPQKFVLGNGQPLIPTRRAGMLTTQWFLSSNIMFAIMPRNAASQAYRAYLGIDIAKSEGLFPIANEPKDYDAAGVKSPACAFCHSTLDPMSYAFSTFEGLGRRQGPVGSYNPNRTTWEGEGYLFNQPVNDLSDWASVAAESDFFKQNLAYMIFEQAIGRRPVTNLEQKVWQDLWQSAENDGYSFDRMIDRFVSSKVFGGR